MLGATSVVLVRVIRVDGWSFVRRSRYHELEALFRRWKLGKVVLGMSTPDMLLHRPVPLLACMVISAVV